MRMQESDQGEPVLFRSWSTVYPPQERSGFWEAVSFTVGARPLARCLHIACILQLLTSRGLVIGRANMLCESLSCE